MESIIEYRYGDGEMAIWYGTEEEFHAWRLYPSAIDLPKPIFWRYQGNNELNK